MQKVHINYRMEAHRYDTVIIGRKDFKISCLKISEIHE